MFDNKKQKSIKRSDKNHKVKYGFLNKKNNSALYISFNSWVKISESEVEIDYNKKFRNISKDIKQLIYNDIDSTLFDRENFIVDLDIRQNGLSSKIKSFLTCEITLYKKTGYFVPDADLNNKLTTVITKIKENCLNDNEYFKYSTVK